MTMTAHMMLPNDLERRQIFHSIKRWSSYTAWNRIQGFYQAWADTIEKSLREASALGLEDKTSLAESDYVSILKGLARFDKGVQRLRQGDKRVFRSNFNGDLILAGNPIDHWGRLRQFIETGDIGLNIDATPLVNEFMTALVRLEDAWGECGPDTLEPEEDRSRATRTFCNEYLKAELAKMTFPDPLAEVPDPVETTLVRTNQTVPCSGIWEPVKVAVKKVISLFKAPAPKGPFPIVGTMAYLHGGASAPPMAAYSTVDGEPTTWRLLWRDDRYLDGRIPDEEKTYGFLQPEAPIASPTSQTDRPSVTVLESGHQTHVDGRWLLQDSLDVSIELAAGKTLPLHQGRHVRWVLAVA